jgi:hypothetical protein
MFLTGIREFNNDLAIYELTLSLGNEILNDEKNTQFSCMFTNSFKTKVVYYNMVLNMSYPLSHTVVNKKEKKEQ